MQDMSELQTQIDRLGLRGKEVWESISAEYLPDVATKLLVLEACRMVDRLDRLDKALKSNGTWLRIAEESQSMDGRTVKIVIEIDSVLAEARQLAVALNAILHKLGVGKLSGKISQGGGFDDFLAGLRELR